MLGRKTKQQPEPEGSRRQVRRSSSMSPAFSYYTSRVSEKPAERPKPDRRGEQQQVKMKTGQEPKQQTRSMLAGAPFWLLLIVIVVCIGKLLMLSTNPKIVVVGETATSASYIQSVATYEAAAQKLFTHNVMNHSKLTVDSQGISRMLQEEFPELQDVSISIPLASSRPVVYIQPASPSLVIQSLNGNYYALNVSGVVLTALHSPLSGLPVVIDQSGGIAPSAGKQVLPSGSISFVRTVSYQLNAAHLSISSFTLPANAPYELDVHLAGKPYIVRFNLEADSLTQSGAAIATIQQLGTTVPSSYIDVRVPGRVYYK